MERNSRLQILIATLLFFALLSGCGHSSYSTIDGNVEIRRTTDGIPHIKAADWFGAGYGYGYVQAEDALCTLAEAFVTYRGQRSLYWGADAKPRHDATFGRARNMELDIFFRDFIDDGLIKEYRSHQSDEIDALVEGFAAGYNRYATTVGGEDRACAGKPWLQAISPNDIYRRMYAAGLAAGYARFIPQIVNARPPAEQVSRVSSVREVSEEESAALLARFASAVGEHPHLGSNALAFGEQATGEEQSVLFGNPHWYWGGPDRFYQAHLTIPGQLNVAGASFLGVPLIMIGFNDQVAWSHTVSTARRYGLFELKLPKGDPAAYQYDGKSIPMVRKIVDVQVRDEEGDITTISHTLYRSQYGPVVDFGAGSAALGWGREQALAIRDINADNFRIFETFLRWNRAQSLDEFVAIQRDTNAIPWVNTVAIGRDTGEVWFADIGRVPFVTDALRERCAGGLSPVFGGLDSLAPLVDGSRAECNWTDVGDPSQAGAMPPERMPALFSEKYVANMNDSYWLTQPAAPIEGLDLILGGEGKPLSLRSQAGHQLADALLRKKITSAQALSRELRNEVLNAQSHSATRFKDSLLAGACRTENVTVGRDTLTGDVFDPVRTMKLTHACQVLTQWSGGGNADDQGSLLWDAWWRRLRRIPPAEFYLKSFSPLEPLVTPAEPNVKDSRIAEALGAAMISLQADGLGLTAPRGSALAVKSGGQTLGLYGGCSLEGYFMVVCDDENGYAMSDESHGNSYLQVVSFGDDGVEAFTLMAHGQHEQALDNGPGSEVVRRYANKQWLRMPFTEEEIAGDASVRRTALRFRKAESRR